MQNKSILLVVDSNIAYGYKILSDRSVLYFAYKICFVRMASVAMFLISTKIDSLTASGRFFILRGCLIGVDTHI